MSRPAASPSHLAEVGDDRNLDQTMGVSPPPGAPFVCLAEAPDDIVRRCVPHAFACSPMNVA